MPIVIRSDVSGLEVLAMALSLKVVLTMLAALSGGIVITVYALLIHRGRFMSSTSMFPIDAISRDIGALLSASWPDSSNQIEQMPLDPCGSESKMDELGNREKAFQSAITLFYLGRMKSDKTPERLAKGVLQSSTLPLGNSKSSRLWLTSGSPTTKCTVQILLWEWASLWLMVIMLGTILAYNGFFTNELNLDSYPRLAITLIYTLAFGFHAFYIWRISLRFFTKVAAGCSWSLIERANFAIAEASQLNNHKANEAIQFRSIEKASEEHIPKTFAAYLKHEGLPRANSQQTMVSTFPSPDTDEYVKDLAAAHSNLKAIQITERDIARASADEALSRVISNAMLILSVTLSCGFSSWTTRQATANTPNNFSSAQIGSLALLVALSTGSALMFSSAMHLSIMEASFDTILSLRELRINGMAVDHYKKRKSQYKSIGFLEGDIPLRPVRFWDVVAVNKPQNLLPVLFLGPALGLLPNKRDFERQSQTSNLDMRIMVRRHHVLLTTRPTKGHVAENSLGSEAINVCHTGC